MANDNTIQTSTQQMRSSAEEIMQLAQNYNTLQKGMYDEGRQLDQTWDGDANQSFNTRLKEDEPRFGQLFDIIKEYVGAINESADDYDKTEAEVAAEMQSNSLRQSR